MFRNRLYFWWLGVKQFFRSKSMLSRLILINIVVWAVMFAADILVRVGAFLMGSQFSLIPLLDDFLAFHTNYWLIITRPWTIVTSLFVHGGFWHLFFNMICLYVFGQIFLSYKSEKQLLATYLIGGVCGNLIYLLAYHTFPVFAPVVDLSCCVGASGAIMAILFAITIFRPNHPIGLLFVGQAPLKWLAAFFIFIDLMGLMGENAGGHFSHLGGALYGCVAALFWLYGNQVLKFKPKVKPPKKPKFAYSSKSDTQTSSASQKEKDEKRIEAILDKIAKEGYGGLTAEEKDFLYHFKR
ncbi:MAG: rhomboid family intramembrane serine protease [Bacteroidales bacterium]|nr:rhomboid family intramembrane serine protease [Bacteroidales bacterium]